MHKLRAIIKKWTEQSLMARIIGGLVIGLTLALTVPQWSFISILGHLFVGALKAIAPLLILVLVAASIARAKSGMGKRFRMVIILYIGTTLMAAVVSAAMSFLLPVTLHLTTASDSAAPSSLNEVFTNLLSNIVTNPVASIASANYIGILFWAVLIGLALKKLASQQTINMVHDMADVTSLIVRWIIQFAPFGILGLVFESVSESGMNVFSTYGHLLALLIGAMLFNTLVTNPLISFLLLRRNPYPLLFTCLKVSGLNAFFTRSSAANIPINLNLCRRLRLDEEFYSVSIPLGATINMNGAAVTITIMTLAVAHTVGIHVGFFAALPLCIIATLGACGASGVAGGSLLLIPMACSFFGISNDVAMQAVAIGFIIGIVQDSMETAMNSSNDVFFTATAEYYDKKNLPHP